MAHSTANRPARSGGRVAASAAGLLVALALAACAPAGERQAADPEVASGGTPNAQATLPPNRRDLPGAGAVAFDPTSPRLAWAAGNDVRILDLRSGEQHSLAVGATVDDLGFAPDGSLWVVADQPARWRAGAPACRARGVEADRLLALDAQGAVVAGYSHSDGVGTLRRQVWLDERCSIVDESIQPLPPDVQDAESDAGEPLRRASLRPPRRVPPSSPPPPDGLQARPIAASADGRWWVFDHDGVRFLWEATPSR